MDSVVIYKWQPFQWVFTITKKVCVPRELSCSSGKQRGVSEGPEGSTTPVSAPEHHQSHPTPTPTPVVLINSRYQVIQHQPSNYKSISTAINSSCPFHSCTSTSHTSNHYATLGTHLFTQDSHSYSVHRLHLL